MNKDVSRLVESYFSGVQTDDTLLHQDEPVSVIDGVSPDIFDPDVIPENSMPEDERTIIEISVQRIHVVGEYIDDINRVISIASGMRSVSKLAFGISAGGKETVSYNEYVSLKNKKLFESKPSTLHIGVIFSPDVKIVQILRLAYAMMMTTQGSFFLTIRDKHLQDLPYEHINLNEGNEIPRLAGFMKKELHKELMIGEESRYSIKNIGYRAYWTVFWKIVLGFTQRYGFKAAYRQVSKIFDNVTSQERMDFFIFERDTIRPLKYGEIISKQYMEGITITPKNCPSDAIFVFQGTKDGEKMSVLMNNPIVVDIKKHYWIKNEEVGMWFLELPGTTLQNVNIVANVSYSQIIMTADIVIADNMKNDRNPADRGNYPYKFVLKLYSTRWSEYKKFEMLAGQPIPELKRLDAEFNSLI